MKKINTKNAVYSFYSCKKLSLSIVFVFTGMVLSACDKIDHVRTPNKSHESVLDQSKQAVNEGKPQVEQTGVDLKAKTEQTFANAGSALKNTTEYAGTSTRAATDKAIEKMDDMAITIAITAELVKDPEIRIFMVNVDTKNGMVTLKGSVPTQKAHDRAGAVAQTFNGVESVDNKLIVKIN